VDGGRGIVNGPAKLVACGSWITGRGEVGGTAGVGWHAPGVGCHVGNNGSVPGCTRGGHRGWIGDLSRRGMGCSCQRASGSHAQLAAHEARAASIAARATATRDVGFEQRQRLLGTISPPMKPAPVDRPR
jgi:hypothetical protein